MVRVGVLWGNLCCIRRRWRLLGLIPLWGLALRSRGLPGCLSPGLHRLSARVGMLSGGLCCIRRRWRLLGLILLWGLALRSRGLLVGPCPGLHRLPVGSRRESLVLVCVSLWWRARWISRVPPSTSTNFRQYPMMLPLGQSSMSQSCLCHPERHPGSNLS